MTIEEAIEHCYKDAEKERACGDKDGCVDEHLQLATWLEELREIKKNAKSNNQ